MRMAGLYNGNSWNEGRGSRKEVAMAKACVTMKALYDIESANYYFLSLTIKIYH